MCKCDFNICHYKVSQFNFLVVFKPDATKRRTFGYAKLEYFEFNNLHDYAHKTHSLHYYVSAISMQMFALNYPLRENLMFFI